MKLDLFTAPQIRAIMLVYNVKPIEIAEALVCNEKTINRVVYADRGKDVSSRIAKIAVSHYLQKKMDEENGIIRNPLENLPPAVKEKLERGTA